MPAVIDACPTSFVDPDLRALESDVIWKIPLRDRSTCVVYVLVEHQTTPDRPMALRVHRYLMGLYGSIVDEARRKSRKTTLPLDFFLPLVLPLVLYCGSRPWDAPTDLAGLLSARPRLQPPLLAGRYFLIDINRLSSRTLLRLRDALSGLLLLEKGRAAQREAHTSRRRSTASRARRTPHSGRQSS